MQHGVKMSKQRLTNNEEPRGILSAVDKINIVYSEKHDEILKWDPVIASSHVTEDDKRNVGPRAVLKSFRYSTDIEK